MLEKRVEFVERFRKGYREYVNRLKREQFEEYNANSLPEKLGKECADLFSWVFHKRLRVNKLTYDMSKSIVDE